MKLELELSKEFHSVGIPILVSPKLLRSRQLGQLDLVRLSRDKHGQLIEIKEVKSSSVGEEMLMRGQKRRIAASLSFLSSLLGLRGKWVTNQQ